MSAHAIDCDYYLETAATPVVSRIDYTALRPLRSPRETLLQGRNESMRQYLALAIEEDEFEPSEAALNNFESFLRMLPQGMPATEPRISYVGSICFDWDADPDNQLGIMLQANNRIAYAAYFSGEKVNGTDDFTIGRFPEELARTISRWIRGNTPA